MALHGQPQPAEQTFTERERFYRQRLVALLRLWPNRSLRFYTCADACVWMVRAPLRTSSLHWSQHNRLQAVPSVQPQGTSEGDEERDVHPSVIQTFWKNSVFPGKIPAFDLSWHLNLGCLIHIMSFNNLTTAFRSGKSSLFTLNMQQQVLRGSSYHQGCRNRSMFRAKSTAAINTHYQQFSETCTCLLLKWTWFAYFLLYHYNVPTQTYFDRFLVFIYGVVYAV